jgi:hypothetical protein
LNTQIREGGGVVEQGERRFRDLDRRSEVGPAEVAPVRLTRKYADVIDGIDLSSCDVGDRLPLPPHDAQVLLAEGWAEPAPARERRRAGEDHERRRPH